MSTPVFLPVPRTRQAASIARIRRERERNRREERERKRRCHDWGDGSTADIISWFKRTPIVPHVASFAPDRFFFVGACPKCTENSRATYTNDLVKERGIARVRSSGTRMETIMWSELARYRRGPEDKPDPTETTFESLVDSVFERVKGQIEEEEGVEVLRSEVAETIGRMGLRFAENFWDRLALLDELRAPLDRFPGGVLYHPGHLEILTRATMCEAPLLFVPFGGDADAAAMVNAVISEWGVARAVPIEFKPADFRAGEGKDKVLSLDLLPEHEVTDLVYQVEQATVLGLLRAGLNAALSLTEPQWSGHVESARRFTLDHFIAFIETRAVNDILVVPVGISGNESSSAIHTRASARVDFDQPFSLREFIKSYDWRYKGAEDHLARLSPTLADHIVSHGMRMVRVMPTSLVSTVLLHRATTLGTWDSPIARSELVEQFAALRGDVARCKRDVGFSGEDVDAVDLALDLLREHLDVRQSDDGGAVVTPKSDPETFNLLSELSLPAVSALAMESVVATAVRSRVKCSVSLEAVSDTHHVLLAGTKAEILDAAAVLYRLVAAEDFPAAVPCDFESTHLSDAFDGLLVQEIIADDDAAARAGESDHALERNARKLARLIDIDLDESDEDGGGGGGCAVSNQFRLNLDSPTLARFSFLTSLIAEQVRCLDSVAAKLSEVGQGEYTVAKLAEELKDVGSGSVRRCLKRLQTLGVVSIDGDGDVIGLTEEWADHPERIDELRSVVRRFVVAT